MNPVTAPSLISASQPTAMPASGKSKLDHRVYRDFDELSELREAWDALAMEEGDVFCSFDWCRLWWRYYGTGRRLEVHVFYVDGHLVAIAPLFREDMSLGLFKVRVVRIVGTDHSTVTCLLNIRPEYATEVLAALFDHVTAEPWDLIHFGRFPGYFQHTDAVLRSLSSMRGVGRVEPASDPLPQTVIDLPDTFDKYLQGLSSRERQNVRKENRRLNDEHGLTGDDAAITDGPAAGIQEFIAFHQSQWTQKGQQGHFADWPDSRVFHADLAEAFGRTGRLALRRLQTDGKLFSMTYAFRFGKRLHWFLSARSMDAAWHFCFPGRVGACDLVRMAVDEGTEQVEVGLGFYPYKMKLGGKLLPVVTVTAMRDTAWSKLKVCLLRAEAFFHEIVGYRFWYLHLLPRVPLVRASLHPRWVRLRMWPADASRFALRIKKIVFWPSPIRRLRQWL